MKFSKTILSAILVISSVSTAYAGFVSLPTGGTDLRVIGNKNASSDITYLSSLPSTFVLLDSRTTNFYWSSVDSMNTTGDTQLIGTFYDYVYRDTSDNTLIFGSRLMDNIADLPGNPVIINPTTGSTKDTKGTEINSIFRNGNFSAASGTPSVAWLNVGSAHDEVINNAYATNGLYHVNGDYRMQATASVIDGTTFKATVGAAYAVNASNYSADTVGFKTDTSVPELNPNSGLYLIKVNATDYYLADNAVHLVQTAGTGSEARPARDWYLSGFAVAAVPEPSEYALMLIGLGMLGFAARRRKNNKLS